MVKALSARLASTFKAVNPSMVQPDDTPLRRVLTQPSQPASNGGLDNELGDLIVAVSDTIASPSMGQFEVLGHLGRGTFGQVLKVRSADNRAFALKVIRNRPAFLQQAEVEVELLRELRLPKPPAGSEGEGAEAARERAAASGDARAMVVQVTRGRPTRRTPRSRTRPPPSSHTPSRLSPPLHLSRRSSTSTSCTTATSASSSSSSASTCSSSSSRTSAAASRSPSFGSSRSSSSRRAAGPSAPPARRHLCRRAPAPPHALRPLPPRPRARAAPLYAHRPPSSSPF